MRLSFPDYSHVLQFSLIFFFLLNDIEMYLSPTEKKVCRESQYSARRINPLQLY